MGLAPYHWKIGPDDIMPEAATTGAGTNKAARTPKARTIPTTVLHRIIGPSLGTSRTPRTVGRGVEGVKQGRGGQGGPRIDPALARAHQLLPRHRDADGLRGRDEMIRFLGGVGDGDLNAFDATVEGVAARAIVR